MERTEWEKEHARLMRNVSTRKHALRECKGPLAEKLEIKRQVRIAEEALRQHKLNYYGYSRPEL